MQNKGDWLQTQKRGNVTRSMGIFGLKHDALLQSEWVENDTLTVKVQLEVMVVSDVCTWPTKAKINVPPASIHTNLLSIFESAKCSDIVFLVEDQILYPLQTFSVNSSYYTWKHDFSCEVYAACKYPGCAPGQRCLRNMHSDVARAFCHGQHAGEDVHVPRLCFQNEEPCIRRQQKRKSLCVASQAKSGKQWCISWRSSASFQRLYPERFICIKLMQFEVQQM